MFDDFQTLDELIDYFNVFNNMAHVPLPISKALVVLATEIKALKEKTKDTPCSH